MRRISKDVLSLARKGRTISETEPVDFPETVEAAWSMTATDHDHAAVDLVVTDDCPRLIIADEDRLRQLLENLFRNAIEHGSTDVTVTIGELDEGFYVEDDGPGIPEDERDEVFDAGYSTAVEGTGFGLSIVKQVADAHGWTIRVTDGSDGGARFEITGIEFAE